MTSRILNSTHFPSHAYKADVITPQPSLKNNVIYGRPLAVGSIHQRIQIQEKMDFHHVEIGEQDRELVVVTHVFGEAVADEDQAFEGGLILRVPVSREKLFAWKVTILKVYTNKKKTVLRNRVSDT